MAYYDKDNKLVFDGSERLGSKSFFRCGVTEKASGFLYSNPYSYQHYGDFRLRYQTLEDTEKSVDASTRQQQVSLARQMFAQTQILDFGVELICDWAVGDHYDLIY